jgi:peptide/nickel transport system ATP-binding protein
MPLRPRDDLTTSAALLVLRDIAKSYAVGTSARARHCAVVRDVTLFVDRGECLAIDGAGLGPLTLLRCAAGLVRPDRGSVEWRGEDGTRVPTPAVALVPGDWRSSCGAFTVRDVLEGSVPAGRGQHEVDRRIAAVLRGCALQPLAGRRAAGLGAVERWRVGVASALVAAAEWLCVELPPGWGSPPLDSPPEHAGAVRSTLLAARTAGRTVLAAGPDAASMVAATRTLRWARGGLRLRQAQGDARPEGDGAPLPRRVAEGGGAASPMTLAREHP